MNLWILFSSLDLHKLHPDIYLFSSEKYFSLHCLTKLFQSNYFTIRMYQSLLITKNYSWKDCDTTEKDVLVLPYLNLNTWKTHWVTSITERVVVFVGCFYVLLNYYWVHFVSKYRFLKCIYKIVDVKTYDHNLRTEL